MNREGLLFPSASSTQIVVPVSGVGTAGKAAIFRTISVELDAEIHPAPS